MLAKLSKLMIHIRLIMIGRPISIPNHICPFNAICDPRRPQQRMGHSLVLTTTSIIFYRAYNHRFWRFVGRGVGGWRWTAAVSFTRYVWNPKRFSCWVAWSSSVLVIFSPRALRWFVSPGNRNVAACMHADMGHDLAPRRCITTTHPRYLSFLGICNTSLHA